MNDYIKSIYLMEYTFTFMYKLERIAYLKINFGLYVL